MKNFISLLENEEKIIKDYTEYVEEHCKNIKLAYEWLEENTPEVLDEISNKEKFIKENILKHDESKYSKEEFMPYAKYFFDGKKNEDEFNKAWEHHYKNNPHHPEYWEGKEMSYEFIIEMICDWMTFSIKKNNMHELINFYENKAKDDKEKNLNEKTKEKLDKIIEIIKTKINELESDAEELSEGILVSNIKELNESVYSDNKNFDFKIFKYIEKEIEKSKNIVIVRHISPDADAIGSAKALYNCLKDRYPNKEITLANESTYKEMSKDDLLIVLDLAVAERIAGKILGNPNVIRFDHHPGNFKALYTVGDESAGSTCELVTLFLVNQEYNLNKDDAELLFKGIITDTGRLQYSMGTTTLSAINFLLKLGIDYKKVYSQLYVKNSKALKTKAYILSNYKVLPNGTAYIFINRERANSNNINIEEISSNLFELGSIKGSLIWALVIDRGNGHVNMSIRSRDISIKEIAEKFGGGGHSNASGIRVSNYDEAKTVLLTLDKYLGDVKKKNPLLKETLEYLHDLNNLYKLDGSNNDDLNKDVKEYLNENLLLSESVLDPINKERCPEIFEKDKMKKEFKNFVMDIINDFQKQANFPLNIRNIYLIGSSSGYQYSLTSDIDIEVELEITPEEKKKIISIIPKGILYPGTSKPINLFVLDKTETYDFKNAENVFDIVNEKWLKQTDVRDAKIPYQYIRELSTFFMNGCDLSISNYEKDEKELDEYLSLDPNKQEISEKEKAEAVDKKLIDIKNDIDQLKMAHHVIFAFEKEGYENMPFKVNIEMEKNDDPRYSVNNLVYKMIDRFGYFDKMKEIIKRGTSKIKEAEKFLKK